MWHRAWMRSAGNQPGKVRHVDEEVSVYRARDGSHALKVERPRIGAVAAQQHLWPNFLRLLLERVVVDPFRVLGHPVGHEVVELSRKVDRAAVAEMAAMAEIHAQHRVTGLEHG